MHRAPTPRRRADADRLQLSLAIAIAAAAVAAGIALGHGPAEAQGAPTRPASSTAKALRVGAAEPSVPDAAQALGSAAQDGAEPTATF